MMIRGGSYLAVWSSRAVIPYECKAAGSGLLLRDMGLFAAGFDVAYLLFLVEGERGEMLIELIWMEVEQSIRHQ